MSRPLKLAIQKSGRLSDDSLSLLASCDFRFPNGKPGRAIRNSALNFPLEVLMVRDDDIPEYVSDGVVDLGILGDNVREESGRKLTVVEKLNFGHCRLSIAVPQKSAINSIKELNGKKIATSYPAITSDFLSKSGTKAEVHLIKGSVEVAPSLGLSDAISDLVSTGSTLVMNGLRELQAIFTSQAVLISADKIDPEISNTLDRFLFRLRAVERGRNLKYLLLNAHESRLKEIIGLLPGLRSPSVIPLSESGWYAIHSVVSNDSMWDLIENLREAGAEGVIVSPVEKMPV